MNIIFLMIIIIIIDTNINISFIIHIIDSLRCYEMMLLGILDSMFDAVSSL